VGWETIALIVVALVVAFVLKNTFSSYGRFWRLIAKNPDLAMTQFLMEPDCVIDSKPVMPRDYVGPFFFTDSRGQKHKVYIPAPEIDAIQARIADRIRAVRK
jgi:hypothetical protein